MVPARQFTGEIFTFLLNLFRLKGIRDRQRHDQYVERDSRKNIVSYEYRKIQKFRAIYRTRFS